MITRIKSRRKTFGTFTSDPSYKVETNNDILIKSTIRTELPKGNPVMDIPKKVYDRVDVDSKKQLDPNDIDRTQRVPGRVIRTTIKITEPVAEIIENEIKSKISTSGTGFNIKSAFIPKVEIKDEFKFKTKESMDTKKEYEIVENIEDPKINNTQETRHRDKPITQESPKVDKVEPIKSSNEKDEEKEQSENVKDTIDYYTDKYGDSDDESYRGKEQIRKPKKNIEEF